MGPVVNLRQTPLMSQLEFTCTVNSISVRRCLHHRNPMTCTVAMGMFANTPVVYRAPNLCQGRAMGHGPVSLV